MKWTLRFLGYATLLAIPAYFLSGPWQRALGQVASAILSRFRLDIEMTQVQIMAPFDLGIYLAMCLASRRAPPLARRRAIEWGSVAVVGLELITVIGAVLSYIAIPKGAGDAASRARLLSQLIEFVPWASAATVWTLLLGAWELPLPGSPEPGRAPPARRPARRGTQSS